MPVNDIKLRMLNWSKQFSILLFPDSNGYTSVTGKYECLLAVGNSDTAAVTDLEALRSAHRDRPDWLFGHISYDYKNNLEPRLSSRHEPRIGFPEFYFFCPQIVCYIAKGGNSLTIETLDAAPEAVFEAIRNTPVLPPEQLPHVDFKQRVDKETYIATVAQLRQHIADGDCYEINFCAEGYSEHQVVDPFAVFAALNTLSPAPFAACYRLHDRYLMCASPERYLQKTGNKILSQPIKGTARRDADTAKDEAIKTALQQSIKERAENVMITDLVRNDLARCCETGSVQVDELFGIYSFPQVHQMISAVSGTLRADAGFTDAIKYSFPMGSMTGAPKHKVMQLTDRYEQSRRELFSGTVGYITPSGDFDFNVVIRSLFYNAASGYLSYQTGGAITYDSDPVQEWEERNLKAWALERIFKQGL
jgi:para-aminobenzoate synthetase component 1